MNILFLDDDKFRTEVFKQYAPYAVCVETAADCIEELKKKDWDKVYLDHDLGNEIFVDSSRIDCGMEVVRYLCKNKCNIGKIVVHTHNDYAGETMVSKLTDCDYSCCYIPFFNLVSILGEENAN